MERLMNESMKQTRAAVSGNEKNVSDGIEETGRAKDEATEILELQSRSNRTVIETQKNIRTSIQGRRFCLCDGGRG